MKRREITVLWISEWAPLLQNPKAWGFGVWWYGVDRIAACLREGIVERDGRIAARLAHLDHRTDSEGPTT
jgi:hypothetical protein